MDNKGKVEWSNIFFAILSLLALLIILSWFFGFKIPTFNKISNSVSNKVNPIIINTNLNCSEIIKPSPIYGEHSEMMKRTLLKWKCENFCSQKSSEAGSNIWITYKSHSCEQDKFICECKK